MSPRTTSTRPLVTKQFDWAASTSVVVCETVSEVADARIEALPPLGESIDPDALDALFDGTASGSVAFQFAGYDVVVRSTDVVEVYPDGSVIE